LRALSRKYEDLHLMLLPEARSNIRAGIRIRPRQLA
jgi:hypothetical protein